MFMCDVVLVDMADGEHGWWSAIGERRTLARGEPCCATAQLNCQFTRCEVGIGFPPKKACIKKAPVIGRYGGASSDLSLILDLVAREMARKHTAFYNIGFSEAKALFRQKLARKWGHAIARGWATLLLDRLRDFVVVHSSAGGNSSFELHTQSMEERATLDRYHHFHGHSGMCA